MKRSVLLNHTLSDTRAAGDGKCTQHVNRSPRLRDRNHREVREAHRECHRPPHTLNVRTQAIGYSGKNRPYAGEAKLRLSDQHQHMVSLANMPEGNFPRTNPQRHEEAKTSRGRHCTCIKEVILTGPEGSR
jgi:hypothetical protein